MTVFVMTAAVCMFGITAKAATLTQEEQTETSVTVKWPSESDASKYYVGIGESYLDASDAATIQVPVNTLSSQSYTFTGLKGGTKYVVCVKYDSKSFSYISTLGSLNVSTLPSKVTGLNQDQWQYYAHYVYFKWDEQTAAQYEYVVRDANNKVVERKDEASESFGTQGSASNVNNNMVYTAQVRACVTINGQKYYGEWSDPAYLMTQPMVQNAYISKKKLKVTWDKVNGLNSYDMYVSTQKDSGYKKVKTLSANKTSVTISKFKGKKFNAKKQYYVYLVGKKKVDGNVYTTGKMYSFATSNKGNGGLLRPF